MRGYRSQENCDTPASPLVIPSSYKLCYMSLMKITDRLSFINKIGRELQSRYTYTDIDVFLSGFEIKHPPNGEGWNSKWTYSKQALQSVSDDILLKIAQELEIETPVSIQAFSVPPRNWKGTNQFRLFISHISQDKIKATRLKECLSRFGISGFVAHEDIHPTLDWQNEIEKSLLVMDAFLTVHTVGFSQSMWTQQEIGFALGRGVKIISLRMGEDPTGFISKRQAVGRQSRKAEEIAEIIDKLLDEDEQTSKKLNAAKVANGLIKSLLDDEVPF